MSDHNSIPKYYGSDSNSEYDSEEDVPFNHPRKAREESSSLVKQSGPTLAIPGEDKPVVFSSNRRRRKPPNQDLLPDKEKVAQNSADKSVPTSKESSTQGMTHDKKNSLFSMSNKISEHRECEEESSDVGTGNQVPNKVQHAILTKNPELEKIEEFENIPEEANVAENEQAKLSSGVLSFCFIIMTITNILINIDHGCLPACTVTIKRDLNIDNASLGFLGSVVYIGLLVGSFLSPPIFHYVSVKSIITWSTVFNAL